MSTKKSSTDTKTPKPFLKKGDTVRIWMEDEKHHPIFGTIDQIVA